MIVKEMIQVVGTTSRTVRRKPGQYAAVRARSNRAVGNFSVAARLPVEPLGGDVARSALQGAETSSLGRALVA